MNKTQLMMESERIKDQQVFGPLATANYYLDVATNILSQVQKVGKAAGKVKSVYSHKGSENSTASKFTRSYSKRYNLHADINKTRNTHQNVSTDRTTVQDGSKGGNK